jgi:hypothetical protein
VQTHFTLVTIASAVLLWLGAGGSVDTRSGAAIEIGVTGRANANASIASSGSFVGVVWAARTNDGVTDVYVATSRDGGRAFGAPVRVNHVRGEASVSSEQLPGSPATLRMTRLGSNTSVLSDVQSAADIWQRHPNPQSARETARNGLEGPPLRFVALHGSRIFEAPVDPLRIAGEHRALFRGSVAHRDDEVESLSEEFMHRLRSKV